MSDPTRTIQKLTDLTLKHYSALNDAWEAPDPDFSLTSSGRDTPGTRTGISNPVLTAITTATTNRIMLLTAVAGHCRDLADLLEGKLGYDVPEGRNHIDHILAPNTDLSVHPGSMRTLTAIHRGWWTILHGTVIRYAATPQGWDHAVDIVDWLTNREEHRLVHQLGRTARHARTVILQPPHEAAGSNRVSCSDPLDRGCNRFLPLGRVHGQCRSCENEKRRLKEGSVR